MAQAVGAVLRFSRQSETSLSLRPVSELRALDAADSWLASAAPIQFELDPGGRGFPEGWVLVTGKLSPSILDGSARLLIEKEEGDESLELPVSKAGTVFELVKLPPRIRRLVWQPSHLTGTFRHTPLTMRRVGLPERRWLMARRVTVMLWTQPAERRRKVGLGWIKPYFDLPGQYRASGKLRSYVAVPPYAEWIERFDRLSQADRRRIRRRIARLREQPRFAIVVLAGEHPDRLSRTTESLGAQLYRNYSVVLAKEGERLELPAGADYVSVLQAGDQLAEHALYWMAEAIAAGGDVAMAYADDDTIDEHGARSDPRFKPDWSPEHLRSINYIGGWAVFRARELAAEGGLRPELLAEDGHELNLRVARGLTPAQVAHVPAVLYHRAASNPLPQPRPRARYPLPANPPLLSIVIPTRDSPGLLRQCVESIARQSTYTRYEILVVDNLSGDPEALAYLRELEARPNVRVLRYDRPFNYADINNVAAQQARGEVLLLLNNDTEAISRDWLEEMLGHLHQEGVGVVGAKLYFPDGRVQHAGDAVGPGGCADHMHAGIAREAPGYCRRAIVAQEVSAVTGACLMTWRNLYEKLGGLDETNLPISFNDVDYCLRVQEQGYRVIFTPHAELFHHESATRGMDVSVEQQARATRDVRHMRRRWGKRMQHDPYYNPNLSYDRPDFSLSDAPRVRKPWIRNF